MFPLTRGKVKLEIHKVVKTNQVSGHQGTGSLHQAQQWKARLAVLLPGTPHAPLAPPMARPYATNTTKIIFILNERNKRRELTGRQRPAGCVYTGTIATRDQYGGWRGCLALLADNKSLILI